MIELAVIIPSWNGRELTIACLDALAAAGFASESQARRVVVVDNGSEDGTAEAVRLRHPWAMLERLACNAGFAVGINAGLRAAPPAHFVALLNNDALVSPGAFEACVDFLVSNPDVAAVGPQLVDRDGRRQNSIHAVPSLRTELIPVGVLELLFPRRYPSKRRPAAGPVDVEALLGACLVVRREAIEAVGGLSEEFFFFLEETDWLLRMRKAGWRVVHLPQVRVVHLQGASSKRPLPLATRIEFLRSLYRFHRKHRGRRVERIAIGLRVAKLGLALVLLAPLAAVVPRQRQRWRERVSILAWHGCGRPPHWGLAGVATQPAELRG